MFDPENPERNPVVGLKRDLLEVYTRLLPAEIKDTGGRNMRALSVGCQFALEAQPLREVLPELDYHGLDTDSATLKAARMYNPDIPEGNFLHGDATDLGNFGQDDWDMIILRNPQVDPREKDGGYMWGSILRNCSQKVKEGGWILFSAHTPQEFRTGLKVLTTNQDMRIVVQPHNLSKIMDNGFPMQEVAICVLKKQIPS